jgi:PAS domain S-box-containing protein
MHTETTTGDAGASHARRSASAANQGVPLTISMRASALDMLPLGLVKINADGSFDYANRAMMDLVGVARWHGLRLEHVFPDPQTLQLVEEHLHRRLTTQPADKYEIDITRADGAKVPIEVSAVQDADAAGVPIGAVSIVRDLTLEHAARRIHQAIAGEQDAQRVLAAMAHEVERLVPCDLLSVSLFSGDGANVRRLYSSLAGDELINTRWYASYPAELALYAATPHEFGDLHEMLARPEWEHRRKDPDTVDFVKRGYRSFIRFTALRDGHPVGALHVFTRKRDMHTARHLAMLRELPIAEAILTAIHCEEIRQMRFVLDLVGDLSKVTREVSEAASMLATRIAEHYRWQHVSVLRVVDDERALRVLSQYGAPDYILARTQPLPIDRGLLGRAYREQTPVNAGDVNAEEFRKDYNRTFKQTRSELCLPVVMHGKVSWLVNVEDPQRNAFAPEEVRELSLILTQVVALLERTWSEHYIDCVFKSARDGLILTSDEGVIKRVNPAALAMLGYAASERDALVGRPLKDFVVDPAAAARLLSPDAPPPDEMALKGREEEVVALVSSASLPAELGDRIIVASDMSWRRRVERLESLRAIYHELAAQTKPSLSLVFTWLRRMQARPKGEWADTLAQTLRQLGRVDLSFSRLMLYERDGATLPYNERAWDLQQVVGSVIERLPRHEASAIVVVADKGVPLVRGDYFQLGFCVESVLAYASRLLPQDGKITVRISGGQPLVALTVEATLPDAIDTEEEQEAMRDAWMARALSEVALGLQAVRTIMQRNGGRCIEPRTEAGRMIYGFEFQAVARE